MEMVVILGPGGHRDASTITNSTATFIDLTAYIGRYVEIECNQAALLKFVPATGTFTFSASGTTTAAAEPTSGAVIGKKVAAATAVHRYVSPKFPRLMVQAQSTSITEVTVNVASETVSL